MNRYFIRVAYDGTAFNGSQIQGEQPTVQLYLNQVLSILLRTDIKTYGASRTDEGVHALGNVYHFDGNVSDTSDLLYRMNAILPTEIAVTRIFTAKNPEANCRFDAIRRIYRYRIHFKKNPFLHHRSYYFPFSLDIHALHRTAAILKTYEDFETFCKRGNQSFTTLCQISHSEWSETESGLEYKVAANRFLRGMVRGLVGTQLQVARGQYDVEEFENRIAAKDCTLADFSVPGYGLYLEEILYPEDEFAG